MAAISQTRFSNAFSWMEMCEFRSRFHWSLFLGIRLTTFQHWFRWWLGTDKATSHYLNRWWLDYRRKYAPLGLTELNGELWNSVYPWWRHQMEIFSALLCLCEGIHWSPVDFPHKGQWYGALMFSLICAWTNNWANNRDAGDFRRHRAHYDIIVMQS